MILSAVALGLLIGLSLGSLGAGGSILTVPALVFALGLTAQQATSGSLVIVGVTSALASIGHARRGHTRWARGTLLALTGLPASLLGTALNRKVDPSALLLAFAVLMVVAAVGMLRRARADDSRPGPHPSPSGTPESTLADAVTTTSTRARVLAAGLGVGFLTGFLGVGGGFVIVPVLVVLLGFDMPVAVGTSLLVIALNSAVALAARLGHGGLVWHLLLPFTLAAVAGSGLGRRTADHIAPARLTKAFAALLLMVAAYVTVSTALGTV